MRTPSPTFADNALSTRKPCQQLAPARVDSGDKSPTSISSENGSNRCGTHRTTSARLLQALIRSSKSGHSQKGRTVQWRRDVAEADVYTSAGCQVFSGETMESSGDSAGTALSPLGPRLGKTDLPAETFRPALLRRVHHPQYRQTNSEQWRLSFSTNVAYCPTCKPWNVFARPSLRAISLDSAQHTFQNSSFLVAPLNYRIGERTSRDTVKHPSLPGILMQPLRHSVEPDSAIVMPSDDASGFAACASA